jgi:hypothetical protein
MRRVASWFVAVVAILTCAQGSEAGHRRGSVCCAASCDGCSPCATSAAQFLERQVTCYRQQMVEKTVTVPVTKSVPVQENYNYTVSVPVTRQVKQMQTVYVQQQKEVMVPVKVCETVTVNETQTVTEYENVTKEIEVLQTKFVPECVDRLVLANCVQAVKKCATFGTAASPPPTGPCSSSCGSNLCNYVPPPVSLYTSTCTEYLVTTKEVTIKQTILKPVTESIKTTVCEVVAKQKQVTVPVCKTIEKEQLIKKIVCESVPTQQEVLVNVCTTETRQETGTRTVYRTVTENVTQKVMTCQMVPYTTTVRVPVAGH